LKKHNLAKYVTPGHQYRRLRGAGSPQHLVIFENLLLLDIFQLKFRLKSETCLLLVRGSILIGGRGLDFFWLRPCQDILSFITPASCQGIGDAYHV